MEGSTIITIAVVAFFVWVLFFRKINPSNKTDAQLQWMYDLAMRTWDPLKKNENLEQIKKKKKKRGLLGTKPTSQTNLSNIYFKNSFNETHTQEHDDPETIDMMSRMSHVMEAVSPIFEQIKVGTKNKEIPEGGIFDSYVHGYIFGFVDRLIELNGNGGIDANPDEAIEIFGIMLGTPYSGGNEGVEFFNECLKDRRAAGDDENSSFSKAFVEGKADYQYIIEGRPAMQLYYYLANAY